MSNNKNSICKKNNDEDLLYNNINNCSHSLNMPNDVLKAKKYLTQRNYLNNKIKLLEVYKIKDINKRNNIKERLINNQYLKNNIINKNKYDEYANLKAFNLEAYISSKDKKLFNSNINQKKIISNNYQFNNIKNNSLSERNRLNSDDAYKVVESKMEQYEYYDNINSTSNLSTEHNNINNNVNTEIIKSNVSKLRNKKVNFLTENKILFSNRGVYTSNCEDNRPCKQKSKFNTFLNSSDNKYFKSLPILLKKNIINYMNSKFKNNSDVEIIIDDKLGYKNPIDSISCLIHNKSICEDINATIKNTGLYKQSIISNNIDKYYKDVNYLKNNVSIRLAMIKNNMNNINNINDNISNNNTDKANDVNLNFTKSTIANINAINQNKSSKIISNNTKNSFNIINQEDRISYLNNFNTTNNKNNNNNNNNNSNVPFNMLLYSSNNTIDLKAYYYYPKDSFPEGRESSSLCTGNYNKSYLYGGIDSQMNNTIWELNQYTMEWISLKPKLNSTSSYSQRHGHSCTYYNEKLFIYGGKAKSNNNVFYPDLEIYDLKDKEWKAPMNYSSNVLKPRKNHIAEVLGNQMIIHGGVDESGNILGDVYSFNFETCKFVPIYLSDFYVLNSGYNNNANNTYLNNVNNSNSPERAWHSSAMVAPYDLKFNNKNFLYNYENHKRKYNYQPGLYIFGGKITDELISNDLFLLSLGRKPCEWQIITSNGGKTPCPRYMCTMNFYEDANILIVHGGRTSNKFYYNYNSNNTKEYCLNDTYIFNLYKNEWSLVYINFFYDKLKVFNRFGHNSMVYKDRLIIFGGTNDENILGFSFFVINFNRNKIFDFEEYATIKKELQINYNKSTKNRLDDIKKGKSKFSQVDLIELPNIK